MKTTVLRTGFQKEGRFPSSLHTRLIKHIIFMQGVYSITQLTNRICYCQIGSFWRHCCSHGERFGPILRESSFLEGHCSGNAVVARVLSSAARCAYRGGRGGAVRLGIARVSAQDADRPRREVRRPLQGGSDQSLLWNDHAGGEGRGTRRGVKWNGFGSHGAR